MVRLAALMTLVAALALFGLTPSVPAQAQGIQVTAASVENRFPEGLLFRLAARSESSITDLRLRYEVQPDGVLTSAVPDFEPSASVNVTLTLAGNDPPRVYLPPGAVIDYFWELEDAAGNTFKTDTATVVYDDVRFDWQVSTAGNLNLHWYQGSQDLAQMLLGVARQTIDDLSALLGAQVDFPVHVWVYASTDDMRAALIRRSESFERQVITAGERVSKDTVLVLGAGDALDTLRHELAHIVTAVAGEGPFGSLPAWLDEGTAVYAQADPGGFGAALERAVARGNVLSLPSISSQPGDPATISLFYGQSWSLVSYLIDTYGAEKFAQLFAAFKAGATIDDALLQVYSFDQRGLEDVWRQSLGLLPQVRPQVEPTAPPAAVPTAPPAGSDGPARPGEDDGVSLGLVVGLIVGLLALATVVGIGGYLISRRLS